MLMKKENLIIMQIPFNKPSIVGNEIDYMLEAISRGHISGQGKYTKLSEKFLSSFFQLKHCSLQVALMLLRCVENF